MTAQTSSENGLILSYTNSILWLSIWELNFNLFYDFVMDWQENIPDFNRNNCNCFIILYYKVFIILK